jgi:chromosome partitioning protein
MKTLIITSQKGGSGKTYSRVASRSSLPRRPETPTVIIDTDPQQTLATWWNIRRASTSLVANVAEKQDK